MLQLAASIPLPPPDMPVGVNLTSEQFWLAINAQRVLSPGADMLDLMRTTMLDSPWERGAPVQLTMRDLLVLLAGVEAAASLRDRHVLGLAPEATDPMLTRAQRDVLMRYLQPDAMRTRLDKARECLLAVEMAEVKRCHLAALAGTPVRGTLTLCDYAPAALVHMMTAMIALDCPSAEGKHPAGVLFGTHLNATGPLARMIAEAKQCEQAGQQAEPAPVSSFAERIARTICSWWIPSTGSAVDDNASVLRPSVAAPVPYETK